MQNKGERKFSLVQDDGKIFLDLPKSFNFGLAPFLLEIHQLRINFISFSFISLKNPQSSSAKFVLRLAIHIN
jgi:hypothetical protein